MRPCPTSPKSTSLDPRQTEALARSFPESDKRKAFWDICSTLGIILAPKPRLNIWQWAERFRYVAKGVSAKTLEGSKLYRTADAPHQIKPQESPTDPEVQVTVLVMASQVGGKTEIFNNVLGYHTHWQPRSSVVMYPTLEAVEKYSKKKFTPMVEASPELARLIRPARERDSGNTILVKDFSGGSVFFVGANSAPSLRGASGTVLLGDEIDSNDDEVGEEGDPVELLFKRGESFSNCVKMLASTPNIKGRSAIWSWFEASDQQYWFVPCVKCGQYQILKWFQIQWPKDEPEKAVLVCAHCAAALEDRQRVEMYHNGQWRPTAPFKGVRGFHLNGIYSPWPHQKGFASGLHKMAADFLRAKRGGARKMKVWVNTFLTEPFEEDSTKVDSAPLLKRAENYTPKALPNDIVVAVAGVDVQKKWLQVEVLGVGLEDETWGIETRVIQGDPEQGDVWQDLSDLLSGTYPRADGVNISITATAIDMRHKPERVRNFARTCGLSRVYPVYGVSGGQTLLVTERFNKRARLRTYAIDTKMAKDTVFARLLVPEEGPRYCHFPAGSGYNEEYFLQLTAEVLRSEKRRGFIKQHYEKERERNEALDIRVYLLACIDILNPAITRIAKRLKPSTPAPREYQLNPPQQSQPAPTVPPAKKRLMVRVGRWGNKF